MAGTLSASSTENEDDTTVTITGSGFTPSADYTLAITRAAGGTTDVAVTADGSGAFTYAFVPQSVGSVTITATPATVAAEATLTLENTT